MNTIDIALDDATLKKLCCPYHTSADLRVDNTGLVCSFCGRTYPVISGIPYILSDELLKKYANGIFESSDNSWKPGKRGWNPGRFTKYLTKHVHEQKKAQKYSLDIGCGENAEGEVNMDVYIPQVIPKNFLIASAEYLPFKDKTFETVKSSYVIEHVIHPAQYILNQIRIATSEVVIITDNSEWIGDLYFRVVRTGRIFHDEHYYRWTVEYLYNLIKRLGYVADVRCEDLSPTAIVRCVALLGKVRRTRNFFCRDLIARIQLV